MVAVLRKNAQTHQTEQAANALFLRYASSVPEPTVIGTIASGTAGGGTAQVVWNVPQVPVTPTWVERIDLFVQIPYQITVPAGATIYVSPFAPWCMLMNTFTIAGSPPWEQVSLVPFWLNEITRRRRYDFFDPGVPFLTHGTSTPTWGVGQDYGTWEFDTGNANVIPGAAITNSGTAAETIAGTFQFHALIRLKQRRMALFGCVPNGQPKNRPLLQMYLNDLVGGNPENNFIQDPNASGATCVTTAASTIYAVWRSLGTDILPAGVQINNPPVVGLGWTVISQNPAVPNANSLSAGSVQLQTAMLYEKVFTIWVNNEQVVRTDYFGLWWTGQRNNARWEYDASLNNFQDYYARTQEIYGRSFPEGVFFSDFQSGDWPEDPSASPYEARMTPDLAYAQAFGIAATPAMQIVGRIPSGTTMKNGYVRTYELGWTEVAY